MKVSQKTYDLLNILAEGLHHGTNANDLLKMFIHAFIESAKHTGPVSPEMQTLLNMLKIDEGWNRAFNFADPNAQTEIAQVVLILQQPGRKGFGLTMIDRPFMGDAHTTYCVDSIIERVSEVGMADIYKELRQVGVELETNSVRETLCLMCDAQKIANLKAMDEGEMPGMGDHEYGKLIEWGNRTKRKPHRTPDSIAQQKIMFNDFDRERGVGAAFGTDTTPQEDEHDDT